MLFSHRDLASGGQSTSGDTDKYLETTQSPVEKLDIRLVGMLAGDTEAQEALELHTS